MGAKNAKNGSEGEPEEAEYGNKVITADLLAATQSDDFKAGLNCDEGQCVRNRLGCTQRINQYTTNPSASNDDTLVPRSFRSRKRRNASSDANRQGSFEERPTWLKRTYSR